MPTQSPSFAIDPVFPAQNVAPGATPTFAGAILTIPAGGTVRGYVAVLGKLTGLNLNAVAATTIFTTPASGFTRCVITRVLLDNFSIAATTASVSFGASGTPTDWAATQTFAGANTNKVIALSAGGAATGSATYGTAVAFVAGVTIQQGSAATCDVICLGFFE
jgi:hypothetical protein